MASVQNLQQLGLKPKQVAKIMGGGVNPSGPSANYRAPAPMDPYAARYAAGQGALAMDNAYRDSQRGFLQNSMGLAYANQNAQSALMQAQLQGSLNDVGIRQGTIGIDRAAAERLIPYYDQLSGLSNQDQAMTNAYYQQLSGLSDQQLSSLQAHNAQMGGLADQMLASVLRDLGFAGDQSNLQAKSAWGDLKSDSIASGSLQSLRTREKRGEIDETNFLQQSRIMENKNQATIGNAKEKASLAQSSRQAALSTAKEKAGYSFAMGQAGLANAKNQLGYAEQKAQANDNIARLDLEAQGLGLKADNLREQLSAGLKALGVSTMMNVNDIMQSLNSLDYQQYAAGRALMQDALAYGNASYGI